jgi:uncharacterized phage-associated protein
VSAPYAPLVIANEFLARFGKERGIEHMKLQKLVYCASGWWLAFHKDSPLLDERPQVWKHGPVFDSLYHALKSFGREPINAPQSLSPFEAPPRLEQGNNQNDQIVRTIDWIWNRYGHLSSFALSTLTHQAGTPWRTVAEQYKFSVPFGTEIPDDLIIKEFREIYEREMQKANVNVEKAPA